VVEIEQGKLERSKIIANLFVVENNHLDKLANLSTNHEFAILN
jgi:hypothetical protein